MYNYHPPPPPKKKKKKKKKKKWNERRCESKLRDVTNLYLPYAKTEGR